MSAVDEPTLDGMPAAPPADEAAPSRPSSRSRTRKPRAEKTPPKPGAPKRTRAVPLAPRVAQAHSLLGLGCSFAPIPNAAATGMALVTHADEIGKAWEALAKENPRVREALEKLLTAGAVGGLLMAYFPVIMAATGKGGPAGDSLGAVLRLADNLGADFDAPEPPAPAGFTPKPGPGLFVPPVTD